MAPPGKSQQAALTISGSEAGMLIPPLIKMNPQAKLITLAFKKYP
jgi:hypothetical protein